jgi:hypothetical protein
MELICFFDLWRNKVLAKIRYLQNRIFYMQMVGYSGTDGLFWYFKFNGNSIRWIFILIYDDIRVSKMILTRAFADFLQKYVHLY